MPNRGNPLFKTVVVSLIVLYGATLAILGFSHMHLLLHSSTTQLDAARQGAAHDSAPTCVVCFRLNTSQPTIPEQQLLPCDLAGIPATFAPPAACLGHTALVFIDGRAPPSLPG